MELEEKKKQGKASGGDDAWALSEGWVEVTKAEETLGEEIASVKSQEVVRWQGTFQKLEEFCSIKGQDAQEVIGHVQCLALWKPSNSYYYCF